MISFVSVQYPEGIKWSYGHLRYFIAAGEEQPMRSDSNIAAAMMVVAQRLSLAP
jgi:hypothetical protein